jgi:CheY-like chemotaxis protein
MSTMSTRSVEGAPRILVADTAELLCRSMARSLDRAGFSCDCALDGPKALELMRAVPYDLIIAASCVRTWGELDLIREARRQGRNTATPFLVISCREFDPREWAQDGSLVRGYLTKPFSVEQLRQSVSRALGPARVHPES